MRESDLFEPVATLLRSWGLEVHGEVLDYDVVGIGKTFNVIVELKTSLSLQLLDQALERVAKADYVFVAVPKKKKWHSRSALTLLKEIGVGLIEVDLPLFEIFQNEQRDSSGIQGVRVIQWGKRFRIKKRGSDESIRRYANQTTLNQSGGLTTSEMLSPYKITMRVIQDYMRKYTFDEGWLDVDTLLENVQTHYSNPKPSVMATLQAHWNEDWVETKKEGRKRYFRSKENIYHRKRNSFLN